MLIEKVLPHIQLKWPSWTASKPINMKQDNAKPHIDPSEPEFKAAASNTGLTIQLYCQPPNSPDMTVLDLGFFHAVQSLQYQEATSTADELVTAVEKAFNDLPAETLNVFLTLQQVIVECIKVHRKNWLLVYFIRGQFGGWPTPALPRFLDGTEEPHITSDESSWVISLKHILTIAGSLPAGYLADTIGRKKTLLLASVPFLLSWVLVSIAKSVELLYIGRGFAGLGLGLSNTVGAMYMVEIAEDRVRGALGTLFMLMVNLGVMFEQGIGPHISLTLLGLLSAIFPILFAVTFVWMPESPYYYLIRNRKKEAEKSLLRLRCTDNLENIKEEFHGMEVFVEENLKSNSSFKDLIFHRGNRKALFITVGLTIFQSLSGAIPITAYTKIIFQESEMSLDPDVGIMIVAIVQIFISVVCPSTVDILGRRPILLLSTALCAVSLTLKGLFFYFKAGGSDMSAFDWVPVTTMAVYISTYTMGIGTIPNVIMGEIFPTNVKGIAVAFNTMLDGMGVTVITIVYQVRLHYESVDAFGLYVVFWGLAVLAALSTVFVASVVPETKGKTLRQIHHELSPSTKREENLSIS
ncbi:facilitated trehalose transporter Tret1-2 homolog [Anabrus simplex]|uniref:facilitated trehalose transporter Tret1-2 homolog n=1 Tax=Anabrus simplex TaxID=316456 RepID=UPI0035A38657